VHACDPIAAICVARFRKAHAATSHGIDFTVEKDRLRGSTQRAKVRPPSGLARAMRTIDARIRVL